MELYLRPGMKTSSQTGTGDSSLAKARSRRIFALGPEGSWALETGHSALKIKRFEQESN